MVISSPWTGVAAGLPRIAGSPTMPLVGQPVFLAPPRPARSRAAWVLAIAVLLGSAVCLVLPHTRATDGWIASLSVVVFLGATIGLFANISTRYPRSGHITLARAEPAFVIGQRRLYHVRTIAVVSAFLAGTVARPTLPEQPWPTLRVITILVFAVLLAVSCLPILTGRPRVELHPGNVRLFGSLIRYDVPWEAIGSVTAEPNPGSWASPQITRLNIVKPDLLTSHGPGKRERRIIAVPASLIYPPMDVAALIDHYLTQPQDRHAIATPDELHRLRDAGLA
jgi:hypothetical protein